MENTCVHELAAQRIDQACGQNRDPIAASLPIADHEFATLQIEILGSQPHRLHQPETGPVHQPSCQTGDPLEPRQQLHHLGACQHHRQRPGLLRSDDRAEIPDLLIQNSLVEKRNRVQGLILGRGSHVSIDRQMTQKSLDFRLPHLPRMPPARKSNEAADPMDVRLLGPNAVMAKSDHPPGLVNETPRPETILNHAHPLIHTCKRRRPNEFQRGDGMMGAFSGISGPLYRPFPARLYVSSRSSSIKTPKVARILFVPRRSHELFSSDPSRTNKIRTTSIKSAKSAESNEKH